jgi:hypothetical protein
VAAWESKRNSREVRVDWQFTTADARIKLKRLYPVLAPNGILADWCSVYGVTFLYFPGTIGNQGGCDVHGRIIVRDVAGEGSAAS